MEDMVKKCETTVEKLWTNDEICSIMGLENEFIEIGEPDMLSFNDGNSITLYVGLNRAHAQQLKDGTYNKRLCAYEYEDLANQLSEIEVMIKISYNTSGMFDMLHPYTPNLVERYMKEHKLKSAELTDNTLIDLILHNASYTGIRLVRVNTAATNKCYKNTKMAYKNTLVNYVLNPKCIQILEIKPINK